MIELGSVEFNQHRKLIITWSLTLLLIFPIFIVLGLLMRLNQGEVIHLQSTTFYALMTLHGLGMAGLLFSFSLAALAYLIGTRYTKISVQFGWFIYALILIGTIGLAVATLFGKFATGWYLLYPLAFKGVSWPHWATGLAIISLIILGVAWLLGCAHVVYALAGKYGGFHKLLGWQYLTRKQPKEELPPIVLITVVSLVPGIISFLAGAVFLVMNLLQHFEPTLAFDPLLLKNLVFFFGHTLVNITMYCAVAWVYALLPEFTGRDWKVNKVVVYSWNATFIFILFAYFHHLYMDFAQPIGLHIIGQVASYLSAIPATVVTMFGVIVQVYRAKLKWSTFPLAVLLGMGGWAIGGFAAVVDSTMAVNKILHNTLWVPAHFHSYMLLGVVLFIFAFLYYLAYGKEDHKISIGFWLFILGASGFLVMFYLGGLHSIPRRYSDYMSIVTGSAHADGALFAKISAFFIYTVLVGLLIMYITLIKDLLTSKKDMRQST